MSKRKQQKNGFFIFMLDMQQELRESGRFVPMRDMPILAGPKWSKLSDAQKLAYTLRAKHEKRAASTGQGMAVSVPRTGKMDSTGELLSERRDLVAEMQERRRREREIIKTYLLPGLEATLQPFYFVDFQSLCEIPDKVDQRFLPCEVSAVEYTLKNGIQRTMHKFIDPGAIPLGYRYQAKSSSELTHQIPIEGFEYAEKDYRMILRELEFFLNPSKQQNPPYIFAKRDNAERVEWCLQWLANMAGVMNRHSCVYEVEALLCELAFHRDGRAPTFYQAEDHLKTSVFDHTSGTRCVWHEERENKHCSLGICKIYCFVLSDMLCEKYGVSTTSAHLPQHSNDQHALVALPPSGRTTPSGYYSGSEASVADVHQRMGHLNIGFGRGRGRGRGVAWMHGAARPCRVGGIRQVMEQDEED